MAFVTLGVFARLPVRDRLCLLEFPIFSRPNPLIDTNKSAMKFDPDQTLRSVEPWLSEIPSDKNVAGRLNIQ